LNYLETALAMCPRVAMTRDMDSAANSAPVATLEVGGVVLRTSGESEARFRLRWKPSDRAGLGVAIYARCREVVCRDVMVCHIVGSAHPGANAEAVTGTLDPSLVSVFPMGYGAGNKGDRPSALASKPIPQ
jgi:hypothetical protein